MRFLSIRFEKIKNHPKYNHLLGWGKLISITGGAQIFVQAVGLISGLLVIRLLPVEQYAYYTLANTMLGTVTVLADSGISQGVLSQGGKVWRDKDKLGFVLATGLKLRQKFAIGSLTASLPILIYLLRYHNASWLVVGLIILSLVPVFFAALSDSLLQIVPKLHQEIKPLQRNQVTVNLGRLILLSVSTFVFPLSYVVILAGGIPRMIGNYRLRKISNKYINLKKEVDKNVEKEILKIVRRVLPGTLYLCFSGQITIWLISFFGSTSSLADLGALGRLSILTSLIAVLVGTLITPRFARSTEDNKLLQFQFFKILGAITFCGIFLVGVVSFFSREILWLLGEKYAHLENELILQMTIASIGLIAGQSYALYSSRGHVIKPIIYIPLNLVSIALPAMFLDLSSLQGVLILNLISTSTLALMNLSYGSIKFSTMNKEN